MTKTTHNLGGEFTLSIDSSLPFLFSLQLIEPVNPNYHTVNVERRYKSSDKDPSHPAKHLTEVHAVFEVDGGTTYGTGSPSPVGSKGIEGYKQGRTLEVGRSGLYFCCGVQYDTDTPKYWIYVEQDGSVKYLDSEHPVVKNGYDLLDACEKGDRDRVHHLLTALHVNPNYIFRSWGALMLAAQRGHTDIVKLLAQHGADVDDIQNWIWITPLQYVADVTQSAYNLEMVKVLVMLGADHTNTQSNLADSIVHYAENDPDVKKAIESGLALRKAEIPSLQKLAKSTLNATTNSEKLNEKFPHLQIKE